LIQRLGSCGLLVEGLPSTTVPASAPATKKIQSTTSVKIDMGSASGNWLRNTNMPQAGSAATLAAIPSPCVWARSRAVPPKTTIQIKVTTLGPITVPRTNCLMVRPV
jgi:hypothetical protein